MRKWIVTVCLVFGAVRSGQAQDAATDHERSSKELGAADVVNSKSGPATSQKVRSVSDHEDSVSPPALPRPGEDAVGPGDNGNGHQSPRLEVGHGYSFVSFRSPLLGQNLQGVESNVTYYLKEWLGIEGSATAAFGSEVFDKEHVKCVTYDAGPRIVLRQGKLRPWIHGLVGGVHMLPQTAGNGLSALGLRAGGGVDYHWKPRCGLRVESNWLHTELFGLKQNNLQVAAGIVIRIR